MQNNVISLMKMVAAMSVDEEYVITHRPYYECNRTCIRHKKGQRRRGSRREMFSSMTRLLIFGVAIWLSTLLYCELGLHDTDDQVNGSVVNT